MAKTLGSEERATKVNRLLEDAYDRLSAVLPSWREDPSIATVELESLEKAATAALADHTKGGPIWPAKRALEAWEAAVMLALTWAKQDPNKCGTCGHTDRSVMVESSDGKRECSRCMQGYPFVHASTIERRRVLSKKAWAECFSRLFKAADGGHGWPTGASLSSPEVVEAEHAANEATAAYVERGQKGAREALEHWEKLMMAAIAKAKRGDIRK